MKILVSAFACRPLRGSEFGVGWEWSKALTETSTHQVTVLTHPNNREAIEQYQSAHPNLRLCFRYIDAVSRFDRLGVPGHYIFYYTWQMRALLTLLRSGEWRQFEAVHHLTYGGLRAGSFLWVLPLPFSFGPVGGAESAPWKMYRSLGTSAIVKELARSLSNLLVRVDPNLAIMQLRARLVLARTKESRRALIYSGKRIRIINDVAAAPREKTALDDGTMCKKDHRFSLLFAGNLLHLKGLDFLMAALHRLEGDGEPLRVDIAGQGPMRDRLEKTAQSLRYVEVRFHGRLPQPELFKMYEEADVFVFPSLHDSGGTAVIEALSFGLPVICFDLGGPPLLVERAGIIIKTRGADMAIAADSLANAIRRLRDDLGTRKALSSAALERAGELTWQSTVRKAFKGFFSFVES